MKKFLTFLFVVVASLVEAQGDFVVNYRGLIAGRASTTNGFVDFYRTDTAYKVRIQGPTGLAASRTFTLPATLGTSGQGLSTDGTGAMSWVSFLRSSDIGSTVQAYNVNLGAIAGLTYGANLCTYWTGAGVAATMSCTSAGRSMLGAADAAAQTALLNSFTGDSGLGGVKGLVTVPASGDALKFLRGDATWQTVDATITHGVTARSGCVAGGISRSTSNLEDCGAGLTFASGVLGITGSATLTNTLSVNLPSGVGSIVGYNLSKTQSATDYGATINFNAGAAGATNLGALGFTGTSGSGNTVFTAGEIKNALAMNASTAIQFGIGTGTPFVNIESTGVSIIRGTTRIGDASLGSTTVPLTARLGTGSTANVFEMQNAAGTVLSYFNSTGLYIGSLAGVVYRGSQTWFGGGAGNATSTGANNTAFGDNSMSALTNGYGNSSFGRQSGVSVAGGQNNSSFGYEALRHASSAGYNSAFGFQALTTMSTGLGYNSAFGAYAGLDLQTGVFNTFIGVAAGGGVTTGSGNTIAGYVTGLPSALSKNVIIADSGEAGVPGQQRIRGFPAITLTEAGGAETVLTLTSTTTNAFTVNVDYMVKASDATPDYAVRNGSVLLACVNNATVVTCTASATNETNDGRNGGGSILINTNAKTLTYAITVDVSAANVAVLKFNIDSDMTVTAANITPTITINGIVTPS